MGVHDEGFGGQDYIDRLREDLLAATREVLRNVPEVRPLGFRV